MTVIRQLSLCVSKTTSDLFGGITGAEDDSALTASPVAGPWNDASNGSVNVLVDCLSYHKCPLYQKWV